MTFAYAFDYSHGLTLPEVASLIGGKAANLGVMSRELGLPVPPGFAISTTACKLYLENGWPYGLDSEINDQMSRLEKTVGRGFGDPNDPLLLSIRSGAPVSMPGMMDTILNLGLNDETAAALEKVTSDPSFVTACRARFEETYLDIVGAVVPDDPWLQLRGAIEAVFRSWNSDRARSYRAREGIADDLGTGVIIQTMVFGNRGEDSATGVLFTRNPATGEDVLYGDLMFNAQGEDVVAGTHQTEPIAVLDQRMPKIAAELRAYAAMLERHYSDVCDIEFTIEQGRLWMLQTRIGKRSPQAALRIAVEMAEDDEFPLDRAEAVARVAHHLADPPVAPAERTADAVAAAVGLGASPGIAVGEIATTPEAAVIMAEAGKDVLLVRRETSPDDVHGMARSAGILTTTGGLASHAAVVARGWGIPAVVGAAAVEVVDDAVTIDGDLFESGEVLTIDGGTGEVFVGAITSGAEIVPEASTLLAWAEQHGIEIEAESREPGEAMGETFEGSDISREDIIHVLLIKGFVVLDDLAHILFGDSEAIGRELDEIVADGLAELLGGSALAGMFQLTEDGKAVGAERVAADREQWGLENAVQALDDLLPLDLRMKEIMTGWQLREVEGQQVINDHSDEAHDAAILADFGALHVDAGVWLGSLAEGLPRLESYVARLDRAAGLVDEGNTDYLASPRLDSYHNVWFELHEDLILLADRTREEEVAAGRA
ncbi:MAG: pyruvate, phosphate dikinase [Acidimicrobiia bacterium]|nr:pyruvate, phosphate dikinase [Acidimicrobiia bacterium]